MPVSVSDPALLGGPEFPDKQQTIARTALGFAPEPERALAPSGSGQRSRVHAFTAA